VTSKLETAKLNYLKAKEEYTKADALACRAFTTYSRRRATLAKIIGTQIGVKVSVN